MTESAAAGEAANTADSSSQSPPTLKDNAVDSKDVLNRPIPGGSAVGPDWLLQSDKENPLSPIGKVARFFAESVAKPAIWVRENFVEPNKGPKYYWYHRKYPRALPIDECYFDDLACIYEADIEYKRNHDVDRATLELLRARRDACHHWYITKHAKIYLAPECASIDETYNREETNFHIKYGDMLSNAGVLMAYQKQKHRMIVDRRRALRKQHEEAQMGQA